MFIEILTKKKELVYLNISNIIFITPTKNSGSLIVDTYGNEYETLECYKDIVQKINMCIIESYAIKNKKCE